MLTITSYTKTGGPLTKSISLLPDGSTKSDGSSCVMSEGVAKRVQLDGLQSFADHIAGLTSAQAISLGALQADLPDTVEIVTKAKLSRLNGHAGPAVIARTADYIGYQPDQPALALIDVDAKGMPAAVRARIDAAGGYWKALCLTLPALSSSAVVMRKSTSTGLYRIDNDREVFGSDGLHIYVLIRDGADVERFLRTLHDRAWLSGFGWMMVGAGGQLLERTLIDRMVYAPERLVFEGAPVLEGSLRQAMDERQPDVLEGEPLETHSACLPLRLVEVARLKELKAQEKMRLAPERAKANEIFIEHQAARICERTNLSLADARRQAERQTEGVLLSDVELPFDNEDLAGTTVSDVMADPGKYVGETLADPLEGIDYGRCKAKVMRRPSGEIWIHSFAHGRVVYELRRSAAVVGAELAKLEPSEQAAAYARLMVSADLSEVERAEIKNRVSAESGVGRRVLDRDFQTAFAAMKRATAADSQDRGIASRRDARPKLPAPPADAPFLPIMAALNEVMGASNSLEPPMRDVEGCLTIVRDRHPEGMHLLTSAGANGEAATGALPPPSQPLLARLDENGAAELIERHINFIDDKDRPVHLGTPFVKHYVERHDKLLPEVFGVVTLPMVMPDGTVLNGRGLNRELGVVFRIPSGIEALIPDRSDCKPTAMAQAMAFLCDEWLVDAPCSYAGKCCIISAVATIVQRQLLPERPAYFISANSRGSGKSTLMGMISTAATGVPASAAAWSSSDEERRKALLAYLASGTPYIAWDNLPLGAAVSCPSIEKALTASTYTDRVLGASKNLTVPASAIQFFNGNQIEPKGDMLSRSLRIRLIVNRTDPENRVYRNPTPPIEWTMTNRARILSAIYTILLGNNRLGNAAPPPAQTRFKRWWGLVGAAIEQAAREHRDHVANLVMDGNDE